MIGRALGKGEVVSSILTGSTENISIIGNSVGWLDAYSAVSGRTLRKHDVSIRVKSVEKSRFVPHPMEASMHIVIDIDGNPWGPFESAAGAAKWAISKWPDQQQETVNDPARQGWDVVALRPPD